MHAQQTFDLLAQRLVLATGIANELFLPIEREFDGI
jgi:hypothetical protein